METLTPFSISFEFFPPKSQEGIDNLSRAASVLADQSPLFSSVTFGAGGSTRHGTLETIRTLKKLTHMTMVPHLSCVGSTREELLEMLDLYRQEGVKRIVTLRGDLPSGMGQPGEFRYASDLVSLIREETGNYFYLDVAAYPEFHPQARSVSDDILNLKRKRDAGANSAITQYFFNPDAYFYYLEDCERAGITIPLIPGIMPIMQFTRLARFSEACGAEIPLWMRKRLESYGDDIESIQSFGLEVIYHLCQRLIIGGAPGLHFYTLNRAEAVLKILKMLNLSQAKMKVYG